MATKINKTEKKSKVFDYKTIKTFEDACKALKVDPKKLPDVSMIPKDFKKVVVACYKLLTIYKAINNGWKPDWSNYSQCKYYPWYGVLSSGFGFQGSDCIYDRASTLVGSRLCTDTFEKALYIAEQFKAEYQDYFLYSK
jgi:hypothetical protein